MIYFSFAVFGLASLIYGFVFFSQEKMIFFPERLPQNFEFNFNEANFTEGRVKIGDSGDAHYLHFTAPGSNGLIIYFHGNAGSLRDWGWVGKEIVDRAGWDVLIVDYPGFGKSTAPLPKNEKPLMAMGRALVKLGELQYTNQPIVLYGRSIGSGIASQMAAEFPSITAVILESPYRSLAKLGREIYPIFPESMSRFDLDNEKSLREFTRPLLVIHGKQDEIIPFFHGESVHNSVPGSIYVSIDGGRHNDLSSFPQYWTALSKFLNEIAKSESGSQ